MKTEKKTTESHMENCGTCGGEFDINKRDNSGYLRGKPICSPCREDRGDYS